LCTSFGTGVYGSPYRDRKLSGVFVGYFVRRFTAGQPSDSTRAMSNSIMKRRAG
jgi:hypothetical protein